MHKKFDLIAIGGGSGGIATVNKAAQFGAKCALIESSLIGGTCVNVGCVPKKLIWLASHHAMALNEAPAFGFTAKTSPIDWPYFVQKRQAYIERLHQGYSNKLNSNQVALIKGAGSFVGQGMVKVGDEIFEAKHIVIATGGKPTIPNIPGAQLAIDSNGFFALQKLPTKVLIIGAGYIAVEFAGMLKNLGCDTTLCFRHETVLRSFDAMLSEKITQHYEQQGINLKPHHVPVAIEKNHDGTLQVIFEKQATLGGFDCIVFAIGRHGNTEALNLAQVGLSADKHGMISVDEYQNTQTPGIYALGDVTGHMPLTPVAIKAGRLLAARLFNQQPHSKLNFENIPTVVFSHPPMGTVGLTETQARARFADDVRIYQTQFTPMSQSFLANPQKTAMKLIVQASTDKVIGCHIIGDGCDEMLQGFAVAITMGARKRDFDAVVAIHPTSSEELVTMV